MLVRTVVAAASVVTLAANVQAQPAGYAADRDELVRRVEAGQNEDGFCATTKFPFRTEIGEFFGYLDSAKEGSEYFARSDYGTSGGCSYYRVLYAFKKDGQFCNRMRSWACFDKGGQAGQCSKIDRTWCRDDKGWQWLKD
ncbi:MAG: hypothetical protein JSS20_01955 [Proteobacteria bacterium]|nr:hypothetical protein [Pseudomonadota bacterium]